MDKLCFYSNTPAAVSMFRTANYVFINGGTFTENHQHHQITSFAVSAIDRLIEAASLGALYNSGERFDPPKCHPNTRTAVLQKLISWFIGKFGRDNFVLWLYGPAGTGKSAIAQTFAELCAQKNRLLASFFFSRTDLKRNNEKNFVTTLAYQLWSHISESRPIIEAVINNNPAIFQLNFDTQFRTLFLNPLLQLSSAGRFTSGTPFPNLIIIDGLDECYGADVQNTILNTISNALQHHPSALPFRFLIVSRPEHHLTTSFSITPLHSLTFRLVLDDTYQSFEDIWIYLTDSFRDIRETHIMRAHLLDSWPSEEDITKLVVKSSGQFIYAAMVIRYVSSPQCNPLDRLKVIQGLLPVNDDKPYAQLDALYINILSDVKDVKTVLRILGMAFVLTKIKVAPLAVNNLERFMQLTPGTVQLLLIDLLSVVDASDNNKPIKFLHASFTDFLIDPTRSCQFFIDPSKSHEEAVNFCICAIESLDIATPVLKLAYWSLLKHLPLAGPLHDNATLREKEFSQTEELYIYHRGILDQNLRKCLASIPMNPCLAFWTAVSASGILESGQLVPWEIFWGLSNPLAVDLSASVPGFLFCASFDQIKVHSHWPQFAWHFLYRITGTPYLQMVREFLNDPSRAGPHAVDQLTYTTAAVFMVDFAVSAWYTTKFTSGEQWDFIWDTFAFTLSRAGYSAELVNTFGKQNLTFNLGRPGTNVRHRVQTLFGAVRNYVLKSNGSNPSPFRIIINWIQFPGDYVGNCFTAEDLDNDGGPWRVFYVDESILPSNQDTHEPAGK
ncbi:hypothetical protein CVT25_002234 [Psilocybe cyanescens]|uniref:Nephrocystin 3-like N-terminal domain-containing protein n=1 Tax=Psilocybe cyanescens TaxID=93625 RepID=A0A409X5I0_PSICY|nr:hypothetical protein CVT25_002234 [Psilocybe cyanescens]